MLALRALLALCGCMISAKTKKKTKKKNKKKNKKKKKKTKKLEKKKNTILLLTPRVGWGGWISYNPTRAHVPEVDDTVGCEHVSASTVGAPRASDMSNFTSDLIGLRRTTSILSVARYLQEPSLCSFRLRSRA